MSGSRGGASFWSGEGLGPTPCWWGTSFGGFEEAAGARGRSENVSFRLFLALFYNLKLVCSLLPPVQNALKSRAKIAASASASSHYDEDGKISLLRAVESLKQDKSSSDIFPASAKRLDQSCMRCY